MVTFISIGLFDSIVFVCRSCTNWTIIFLVLITLNIHTHTHTKELRPDILNLCEVEGCDEVAWLAERLNEEEAQEEEEEGGGGYGYYLVRLVLMIV